MGPDEERKMQQAEWIFKIQFLSAYYLMQGMKLAFILFLFLMKIVEIQMDFRAESADFLIDRLHRIQLRVRFTAIMTVVLIIGFLPAYIIMTSFQMNYFFQLAI